MQSRRYKRILATWLLVWLAAAIAPAQAAVWRCDDGRACVTGGRSCCPSQRQSATCAGAAMPCCQGRAANPTSGTTCCVRGRQARSTELPIAGARAHCRCSASYQAHARASVTRSVAPSPGTVALPSVTVVLAPAARTPLPHPIASIPRTGLPSSHGGRAPPSS